MGTPGGQLGHIQTVGFFWKSHYRIGIDPSLHTVVRSCSTGGETYGRSQTQHPTRRAEIFSFDAAYLTLLELLHSQSMVSADRRTTWLHGVCVLRNKRPVVAADGCAEHRSIAEMNQLRERAPRAASVLKLTRRVSRIQEPCYPGRAP